MGGQGSLPEDDWSVDLTRSGASGICGDSWASAWFGIDPSWSFHRIELLIAAGALVILAVAAFTEHRRGIDRERCRRCGHPTLGAQRCPECGQDCSHIQGLPGQGTA